MSDHWPRGHLVELTTVECFDLLATDEVGRIVYSDERGPLALPVNYVVQEGTFLFRISSAGSLGRHLRETTTCAFEVDQLDHFLESGWSVLARGSAALVRHPEPTTGPAWPDPWPEGTRSLLIRFTPDEVSGRRLSGA